MTLGEKIKEARISAKMTQSQLADGKITRNMLSQIETGKARPSLETVYHIAAMLNIDPAYFIGNESRDKYTKFEKIDELKKLYIEKKYESCIHFFEKHLGVDDDETALIIADCYFRIGETHLNNGYPKKARTALEASLEYTEKTIYPTEFIKARIALLLPLSINIQSPRLEFDDKKYLSLQQSAVYSELYHYLSEDFKYPYESEMMQHISAARNAMKAQDYNKAVLHLSELDNSKPKYKIPSYVLFRLYGDLESCYKELKNFELAYKYSSKRIALISAFKM